MKQASFHIVRLAFVCGEKGRWSIDKPIRNPDALRVTRIESWFMGSA